jgi:hypothetical protein
MEEGGNNQTTQAAHLLCWKMHLYVPAKGMVFRGYYVGVGGGSPRTLRPKCSAWHCASPLPGLLPHPHNGLLCCRNLIHCSHPRGCRDRSAGSTCVTLWLLHPAHDTEARLTALAGVGAGAALPFNDLGRWRCKLIFLQVMVGDFVRRFWLCALLSELTG